MRKYPECINELYESEVLGEAVFVALCNAATSEEHRYKFGTMAQLETETKARLRPFLAKYAIKPVEKVDARLVAHIVESYAKTDWKTFMQEQREIVGTFVRRFEDIERMAPAEDLAIVHSMVIHERAIMKFVDAEATGRPAGSLDDVVAQLHFPLPNPKGF